MKLFNNKGFVRKILIVIITITLLNFVVPVQSQAADIGGKLFKPIFQLLGTIADVPIGLLHHFMLDTSTMFGSVMLDYDDMNIKEEDGIWHLTEEDYNAGRESGEDPNIKHITKKLDYKDEVSGDYDGTINKDGWGLSNRDAEIPNILYCPEYIFSNRIAALDVNFINPGEYKNAKNEDTNSIASNLTQLVASWYKALRNIAIVGLLSILVYIGIRILIGSTAQDKAKYKERLKDWFVGFCLLFAMHYIMAGVMMISELITTNLSEQIDEKMIYVEVQGYKPDVFGDSYNYYFKTNYMGYIRFMVQSASAGDAFGYLIMYIALVVFTVMFTIIYLKRVLYMAFFTIIAPLVAMTYPLDKLADGNAQGFNMWFREYMLNAIIQPVHLILYTIIISSVIELAVNNPLYGIVALAFLLPAEKFIKKMFRFEKGETTSALGAVAGGAFAMKGLQSVSRFSKGLASGKGGANEKIRTRDNEEIEDKRGKDKDSKNPFEVIAGGNNNTTGASSSGNSGDENVRFAEGAGASLGSSSEDSADENVRFAEGAGASSGSSSGSSGDNSEYEGLTPGEIALKRHEQLAEQDGVAPSRFENGVLQNWNPHTKEYQNAYGKDSYDPANDTELQTPPPPPPPPTPPTFRQRFNNVGNALGGRIARSAKRAPGRLLEGGKKTLIKGVKSLPRMAIKTGAMAAGVAATGAIAAGAAITAGDAKTAASMMGTGALIGAGLGNGIGGKISDRVEQSNMDLDNTIKDSWYTKEDREKQKEDRRKKYDKEWKQREENYNYLRNRAGMNNKDAKNWLEDSETQAFLSAGVTDINTIYNGRELLKKARNEGRSNWDLKHVVAEAQISQKLSDGFEHNESEKNALAEGFSRYDKNLNTKQLIEDISFLKKKPS
ncbi:MAG: FUSC family protein [Clostridia bacterium]|nr:FUSC family protein [Clostridia bacterium]